MVAAVSVGDLFLPVAMVLWVCFQSLLATHVASCEIAGPGWLRYLQVVPLLGAAVLIASGIGVAQVPGDSGLPNVRLGEWLLLEAATDELPRLGDAVAVRCTNDVGGVALARVVGLPGDRLHLEGRNLCRNGRCFPTAPMVLEDEGGGVLQSAIEVVGGRSHILLSGQSTDAGEWSTSLPALVADGHLALLPDNRVSISFGSCTGGEIILSTERIAGRPAAILYSSGWSRVGLRLK